MLKQIFKVESKIRTIVNKLASDEKGMELWQMMLGALIALVLAGVILKFFDTSITELGGLLVNKTKSTFNL